MTCARDFAVIAGAPATAPHARVTRVEKSNPSSTLRQRPGSPQTEVPCHSGACARDGLPRFETEEAAPLWYGPILRSAFVAQVLGQVFPGSCAPASPAPAYRSDRIPKGLLLDEKA